MSVRSSRTAACPTVSPHGPLRSCHADDRHGSRRRAGRTRDMSLQVALVSQQWLSRRLEEVVDGGLFGCLLSAAPPSPGLVFADVRVSRAGRYVNSRAITLIPSLLADAASCVRTWVTASSSHHAHFISTSSGRGSSEAVRPVGEHSPWQQHEDRERVDRPHRPEQPVATSRGKREKTHSSSPVTTRPFGRLATADISVAGA